MRFTFYISCFLFCVLHSSAQQPNNSVEHNRTIDSLLTLLKSDRKDTNKVKHLYQLSFEYRQADMYVEGLKYGHDALNLSIRLHFRKGMADSYNNIGIIHWNKGEYDKAMEFYFKSLKITEELGNKKGTANTYNNIGIIYWNKGDYDKALEFYFKSLKIAEEFSDRKKIANTYNNIGLIYWNKGDNDKALEFYFKSLKIREEIDDKKGMAMSYNNIGIIHKNKGDYDKALEFYFKNLSITEKIGDKNGMAATYGNIGNLYCKDAQFGRPFKKFADARIYLNKGLKLSTEIGTKEYIRNAFDGLSQLESALGNWKSAFHYHQLYSLYSDSLFNEKTTKQIADMQTKYEADKKEKENSILRKNKEIRILQEKQKEEQQRLLEEKIERRNRLQYSAIVLGLFVLFLGIFLFAKRFGKFTEHRHYRKFMKITEVSLFISFLIFFEFITVVLDPYVEKFTGGEPLFKLILNAVLATIIFPIHHYLEKKLSGAFIPGGGNNSGVGKYLIAFGLLWLLSNTELKTFEQLNNRTFEHLNNRTFEHLNI